MTCPTCEETLFAYLFVVHGLPIARCRGCGLIVLGILPRAADFSEFYQSLPPSPPPPLMADSRTERDAAARYWKALGFRGWKHGRMLVIGAPGRDASSQAFLAEAKTLGVQADFFEHASGLDLPAGPACDAAVLLHCLQTRESPGALLEQVHSRLAPGAQLLVSVPDMESWPARFFGQQWTEWRPENHIYFDPKTIQLLLLRHGFRDILVRSDRRLYTLHHIYERAANYPRTVVTRLIAALHQLMPPPLRQARLRLATSGMVVTAVKAAPSGRPKCSIVIPAFNESKSFPVLMDALLARQIPGMDREMIIVESNSTDGTREIARRYESHPEVQVILEEKPRGKGHAVRAGLREASGDIVLIQDADLEYDLNDYDSLLAPILSHRALFVLGARHGGDWKMRHFVDQKGVSTALNFGHLFFTGVINTLYRQKMRDPFTMYKVFHRDCLYGLRFECNRFDFDHELVIKLVRKGYVPLEIPVNYWSRSFRQGKKVRVFRDPFGWLWVDVKLRFQRVMPRDWV
jgi:SAM-dependent methyltransferase